MKQLSILLAFCLLPSLLMAGENRENAVWDSAPVVKWLWASEKPDHQAAAILLDSVATGPDDAGPALSVEEIAARLPALIQAADSRASVALMTGVCSRTDWKSICREAGFEHAILRYADGNLLLRGQFLDSDPAWETAISQAPIVKDVAYEVTESIYNAYLEYLQDNPDTEWQELAGLAAFGISMAVPHDYQSLLDHCVSPGDGLQEACLSIERQLQHDGSTLLTRAIGYALERQRLKAIGELEAAEVLERRSAVLTEFSACVGRSTPDTFSRPAFETWLDLGVNDGELAAMQYLAGEFGADCDLAAL